MPQYFFDVYDGDQTLKDDQGTDLADDEAARREAAKALADMARDYIPKKLSARELSIDVRDKDSKHLFSVSITFKTEPPA